MPVDHKRIWVLFSHTDDAKVKRFCPAGYSVRSHQVQLQVQLFVILTIPFAFLLYGAPVVV